MSLGATWAIAIRREIKEKKKKNNNPGPNTHLDNSQMPVTPTLGNQMSLTLLGTQPHKDIHKKTVAISVRVFCVYLYVGFS